jgi:hypothetical protein
MTNDELKTQNDLADALIDKIGRIKSAWDELPNLDDLEEMVKHTKWLVDNLEKANTIYNSEDFPNEDSLRELVTA